MICIALVCLLLNFWNKKISYIFQAIKYFLTVVVILTLSDCPSFTSYSVIVDYPFYNTRL
jgi:hypothetical protein